MSILSMPTSPGFKAARFLLRGNTQEFRSPLSQSVQTLELTGSRWEGTFELPPMERAKAADWVAFLASLNGRAGRFYAGDPAGKTARGVATGTPLVNGASQTGTTLNTDGWTPSVTGILLAGDYVAFDTPSGWRELHMIAADADSDATGAAALTVAPPLRESPADDEPLILSSPTCVMMLASDEGAAWDLNVVKIFGLRFSAIEAFEPTS